MNQHSDVVVVGGGVIGCSVAWSLSKRGISVTLVDKSFPGRATSASAGGLWPIGESIGLGCGVIYHASTGVESSGEHPEPLSADFMSFLCESNNCFPSLSAELVRQAGLNIEAESGTGLLYLLFTEKDERHADYLLDWVGVNGAQVSRLSKGEALKKEPLLNPDLKGAIYFPGDNQVNPMYLAEALKRGACANGAQFVSEAEVTGLVLRNDSVKEVRTTQGTIACGALVNAAGAWSVGLARMAGLELSVYPVRGQIVCTHTLKKTLHCNLSSSQCYLLQKAHGEVLIGSTTERCEYDAGVRFEDICALSAGAIRSVPTLQKVGVKRTWAGLRPGTPDELPILGPVTQLDNYFNATGGFRTGIVAAPLTGEIVAAYVAQEALPFPAESFLQSRFDKVGQDRATPTSLPSGQTALPRMQLSSGRKQTRRPRPAQSRLDRIQRREDR